MGKIPLITEPHDADEGFMRAAIKEAMAAEDAGDVPIGAVVVREGRIIGRGHNQRELLKDPTAHAEMLALTAASSSIGSWRLEGCTLYVTLEPCAMCAGAIILSRIEEVHFGALDPKAGCTGSLMNLLTDDRFNHQPKVQSGLLAQDCGAILSTFFREIRARKSDSLN